MSLLDFIFPDQAQAVHLGEIADVARDMRRATAAKEAEENGNVYRIRGLDRRIAKLEGDVALLATINALLIRKYIEDTGKSPAELQQAIAAVDASDGVADGGLDTAELRRIAGLPPAAVAGAEVKGCCPDCGRVISKSLNRCLYCGGLPA